jgi:hypothetical protein
MRLASFVTFINVLYISPIIPSNSNSVSPTPILNNFTTAYSELGFSDFFFVILDNRLQANRYQEKLGDE